MKHRLQKQQRASFDSFIWHINSERSGRMNEHVSARRYEDNLCDFHERQREENHRDYPTCFAKAELKSCVRIN